jgi:hypothetical protein
MTLESQVEDEMVQFDQMDTKFDLLRTLLRETNSGEIETDDVEYEWGGYSGGISAKIKAGGIYETVSVGDESVQGIEHAIERRISEYNDKKQDSAGIVDADEYNEWERNREAETGDMILVFEGVDGEEIILREGREEDADDDLFRNPEEEYHIRGEFIDGSEKSTTEETMFEALEMLKSYLNRNTPVESYVAKKIYEDVYEVVIEADGVGDTYAHKMARDTANGRSYNIISRPDGMGYNAYWNAQAVVEEEFGDDLDDLREQYRNEAGKYMIQEFDRRHDILAEAL